MLHVMPPNSSVNPPNRRTRCKHGFRAKHNAAQKAFAAARLAGDSLIGLDNPAKAAEALDVSLSMVSAAKLLLKQQDYDLIDVVLYGGESLMKVAGEIRQRNRQAAKGNASDVTQLRILAVR
jgi:hypothetical protein